MTQLPIATAAMRAALWDDNPATTDLLGFDVVVDAVTAALHEAHLDPVTIGVHAPWGGGKSTVLGLIKAAKDEHWLVIRTNPWEYDDQLDPKGTLITEILTALAAEVEKDEGLTEDVKKLVKRVSWSRLGVAVAKGLLMMQWDPDRFVEALNPENPNGIQSLAQFRTDFANFVSKLPNITRVVVLVDDLDRCLPDAVMATMEAIKLFLSVKGMAFVIAADQDMVKNAIQANLERSNRSQVFAEHYLEKIVQLPVSLPRLSHDDAEAYIGLLLAHAEMGDAAFTALVDHCATRRRTNQAPFLFDLEKIEKRPNEDTLKLASQLAEGMSAEQLAGPREIKRFLNAFGVRSQMAKSRGLDMRPEVIVKLLLLEERFRKDFDVLAATAPGERPDLLRNWEAWGRKEGVAAKPDAINDASQGWAGAEPRLAERDLNPYITLAATLAASRLSAGLSDELRALVQRLLGDVRTDRDEATETATALPAEDQRAVAQALVFDARRNDVVDPAIAALTAIGTATPGLQGEIVADINLHLATRMTPGGAAELAGSKVDAFRDLAKELSDNIAVPDAAREAAKTVLEAS